MNELSYHHFNYYTPLKKNEEDLHDIRLNEKKIKVHYFVYFCKKKHWKYKQGTKKKMVIHRLILEWNGGERERCETQKSKHVFLHNLALNYINILCIKKQN